MKNKKKSLNNNLLNLKFRVWHIKEKFYYDVINIDFKNNIITLNNYHNYNDGTNKVHFNDVIIEPHVHKGFYIGDLVKFDNSDSIWLIYWCDGFTPLNGDGSFYGVAVKVINRVDGTDCPMDNDFLTNAKVVGNINFYKIYQTQKTSLLNGDKNE